MRLWQAVAGRLAGAAAAAAAAAGVMLMQMSRGSGGGSHMPSGGEESLPAVRVAGWCGGNARAVVLALYKSSLRAGVCLHVCTDEPVLLAGGAAMIT